MHIGFFGGSFDPPHRGHLAIARAAIKRLALHEVWMAPVGVQPLKPGGFSTSFADRLAMVKLAVAGDYGIAASSIDAPRSDGKPNYTLDVLTSLRAILLPGDKLFFLLGADAFLSLKQWHGAEQLPFLAEFIVAGRPGFEMDDLAASLPASVRAVRQPSEDRPAGVLTWSLHKAQGAKSRLYFMPDLHEDISATHIRAALAGEESEEDVLAPAVLRYIHEHGLYR